jgi:23S rRNA (cytosine1962-C5)-methyltransferase
VTTQRDLSRFSPGSHVSHGSTGYALLDFGDGRRLEQWGPYRLIRPDAAAQKAPILPQAEWEQADARFEGRPNRGRWITRSVQPGRAHVGWERGEAALPASWVIRHADIDFEVKLAPSMHTGLFPEQAQHWRWMREVAAGSREPIGILNLFAYTGGASVSLARDGHQMTHVDTSRPVMAWARRVAELNGVASIRWIEDDARRFLAREITRRRSYQAILLDPPRFGHGPSGPWKIERDLPKLLAMAVTLLRPDAAFLLVNEYGRHQGVGALRDLVGDALSERRDLHGRIEAGVLRLEATDGRQLSTGVYARWIGDRGSGVGDQDLGIGEQ